MLSIIFLSETGFLFFFLNYRSSTLVQFSATALIHAKVPEILIINFTHTQKDK